MFTALLLPLLAAGPGPVTSDVSPPKPPIELWINNDRRFLPSEAVRVHVQTEDDGYLLVLHADPDGRVRVLFPLDPHDDNFIRGGKRYEVHGRAGREAFEASITGRGMIYAAVSKEPFRVRSYAADGHWDYESLAPDRLPREPEAELTELVRRMAESSFDYDVLTYDVIERVYRATDYSWYPSYRHWYADPLCDPYFYDSYCRPYGGSYLSVNLVFGRPYRRYYSYDPYYYNRYYDPFYYSPYYYRPVYVYPRQYAYPRTYYRYPSRFGDRRPGAFTDYRDRRLTSQAGIGYRATFPAERIATPVRRRADQPAPASAPMAQPGRRVAPQRAEPRRSPIIERRPVEGRRARPVEPRRDATPPPSRPTIDSRPVRDDPDVRRGEPEVRRGEPEARRSEPETRRAEPRDRRDEPEPRRVERRRDDAPAADRPRDETPAPERRAAPRDDSPRERAAPREEPRRREAPSGDRSAGRGNDDGGRSSGRPSGNGGGGRRR